MNIILISDYENIVYTCMQVIDTLVVLGEYELQDH